MAEKLEPKKDVEVFKMDLNGRSIVQAAEIFRLQAEKLFNSRDFKTLGLSLPDKFLQLDGPQPLLAELTVLANKLKMQVRITYIEIVPFEKIEAENAAAATTGK